MSEDCTPFATVFRPAFDKFCWEKNIHPTHLLIGPKEFRFFEEEGRQHFQTYNATITTRTYSGVQILVTYDVDSIMHFFVQ